MYKIGCAHCGWAGSLLSALTIALRPSTNAAIIGDLLLSGVGFISAEKGEYLVVVLGSVDIYQGDSH